MNGIHLPMKYKKTIPDLALLSLGIYGDHDTLPGRSHSSELSSILGLGLGSGHQCAIIFLADCVAGRQSREWYLACSGCTPL